MYATGGASIGRDGARWRLRYRGRHVGSYVRRDQAEAAARELPTIVSIPAGRFEVPPVGRTARVLLPSLSDGRERWHQVTIRSRVRAYTIGPGCVMRLVRVLVEGETKPRDVAVERMAMAVAS